MKQIYDLFDNNIYKDIVDSCVYKLTTPCNNYCYIGSTKNFSKRMKDHRNDLKNNRHGSKSLQDVINKNGLYCTTEILEFVKDDELLTREKFYIELYNAEYNAVKDPTTQINNSSTSKTVYQYDMDGNFIKQWKSIGDVKRELKIQVSPALNKENRSAGKYQWRTYMVNNINNYKPQQGARNIIHVYDIFGKYIESLTIEDINKKYYNNISIDSVRNLIWRLCRTSKSYNKLRFSRTKVEQLDNKINLTHKENFIILQFDLNMNFINAYDSIGQAQKELGFTSIYDNIIGKTHNVNKQYIFKKLGSPLI